MSEEAAYAKVTRRSLRDVRQFRAEALGALRELLVEHCEAERAALVARLQVCAQRCCCAHAHVCA